MMRKVVGKTIKNVHELYNDVGLLDKLEIEFTDGTAVIITADFDDEIQHENLNWVIYT